MKEIRCNEIRRKAEQLTKDGFHRGRNKRLEFIDMQYLHKLE